MDSTDKTDKWLETVEKLLAKADDPNVTEAERAAFVEKAEYLMIKYSIDAAVLQARQIGQADEIIIERIFILNPYATSKSSLINTIALSFRCRTVLSQGWNYNTSPKTRTNMMTLIGYSQDVAKVKTLYASLSIQLYRAIETTRIPSNEHGKTFRTGIAIGFIGTVSKRLRSLTEQVKSESSTGTDLVLYNRDKDVEARLNSMFPKLTPGRSLSARNTSGYASGREAGNRADIGLDRIGQTRKAIG